MTRCQTCNKGFPQAYAIQWRVSDGRLECIDCCMKREDREQLNRLHHVDYRCAHGSVSVAASVRAARRASRRILANPLTLQAVLCIIHTWTGTAGQSYGDFAGVDGSLTG